MWDLKEISVGEDQETVTNFKLTRYTRPPSDMNNGDKADWEKIAGRRAPFDHAAYQEENSTKIASVGRLADRGDDLQQSNVLYRIGYRKEGTHGQQEMATALDAFVKKVTILESEKTAVDRNAGRDAKDTPVSLMSLLAPPLCPEEGSSTK